MPKQKFFKFPKTIYAKIEEDTLHHSPIVISDDDPANLLDGQTEIPIGIYSLAGVEVMKMEIIHRSIHDCPKSTETKSKNLKRR